MNNTNDDKSATTDYNEKDPEPVVKTLFRGNGIEAPQVMATVTVNRYKALVLNTDKMFIADIDKLKQPLETASSSYFDTLNLNYRDLPSIEDLSFRVYRTFAGYRLLLTSDVSWGLINIALLDHFLSDPKYVAMCQVQKCYRARLSPKPWRLGIVKPESTINYTLPKQRVCKLVAVLGSGYIHPHLSQLVHYHDKKTKALLPQDNPSTYASQQERNCFV